MLFPAQDTQGEALLAYMNSAVSSHLLEALAPTLDFNGGTVSKLPLMEGLNSSFPAAQTLIRLARADWDAYERSWDFQSLPLLTASSEPTPTLESSYTAWITQNRDTIAEMKRLEEENNRLFIDAYGLADELTPDVPIEQITLTVNPAYRYGGKLTEEEQWTRFRQDTMKEFISYAVGCMFGRYSLDKPGLILANQGETVEDYWEKIGTTEHTEYTEKEWEKGERREKGSTEGDRDLPLFSSSVYSVPSVVNSSSSSSPSFAPDADNVIPILSEEWFEDDIAERFKRFLRVTFGAEHYEQNLRFLEASLYPGKRNKGIRDYFLKDFYTHHVQTYKKRPIYWLFSSPKGSFNALIYMHRYRPDTLSIILNNYLREFRTKLSARIEHLQLVDRSADVSQAEKTKALKQIDAYRKVIDEITEYENDILYPLAARQLDIDLDDGVVHNYNLFGTALKKVTGLSGKASWKEKG